MVVGAGACWLLPGVDDVAMFAWYVMLAVYLLGSGSMVVAGARRRRRRRAVGGLSFCSLYVS